MSPRRPSLAASLTAACLASSLAVVSLALGGCDRLSKVRQEAPASSGFSAPGGEALPPAASSAGGLASRAPSLPQSAPPAGPAPDGSASREERQATLLSLLSGATSAGALPQAATAPGMDFDPGLRRQLTTVEVDAQGRPGVRPPSIRMGSVDSVVGHLPQVVIQRIVRQQAGQFRLCYEKGLSRNPSLAGRVVVGFVIGTDGSVGAAADKGSDIPDKAVVSCVVRVFHGISFPSPEGGIATVVYPISFAPGD